MIGFVLALAAVLPPAGQEGQPARETETSVQTPSHPPPPHPGGLPPPPPPSPWDNPELGARIDELHSEYLDIIYSKSSMEAERLIADLSPPPDQATLRAVYGKLLQVEDQVQRLRSMAVDVHALGLASAKDMSLHDARRVAGFLLNLSVAERGTTASLNELKASREAAIRD